MPERVLKDLLPKPPKGWYWETGFKRSGSTVVKEDWTDYATIKLVSLWHWKEYKRDVRISGGTIGTRRSIQDLTEAFVSAAQRIVEEFDQDHAAKGKIRAVKQKRAEISSLIGSWR